MTQSYKVVMTTNRSLKIVFSVSFMTSHIDIVRVTNTEALGWVLVIIRFNLTNLVSTIWYTQN